MLHNSIWMYTMYGFSMLVAPVAQPQVPLTPQPLDLSVWQESVLEE